MLENELWVWRTLRAVTVMVAIIALLFMVVLLTSYTDRYLAAFLTAAPAASTSSATGGAGTSVRVQTYAEIAPGAAQRRANAWADGATMQSASIADGEELHAEAQAAWPATATLGSVVTLPAVATVGSVATPAAGAPRAEYYISAPLANVRAGPGTDYPILRMVGVGDHFPITGKWVAFGGDWWQIDTGHGLAWMHSALGVATGDTAGVAMVTAPSGPPPVRPEVAAPTVTPAPTVMPTVTALPAVFAYSVETVQRHSEANTVVIYGYVHERGLARDSAYLWVSHNGATYRSGPSSALIAGTTKPVDTSSPENVAYNVKIDFPSFLYPAVEMSGEWTIVLVDGTNQALSPVTVVTIAPDDTRREIYLRFRKN